MTYRKPVVKVPVPFETRRPDGTPMDLWVTAQGLGPVDPEEWERPIGRADCAGSEARLIVARQPDGQRLPLMVTGENVDPFVGNPAWVAEMRAWRDRRQEAKGAGGKRGPGEAGRVEPDSGEDGSGGTGLAPAAAAAAPAAGLPARRRLDKGRRAGQARAEEQQGLVLPGLWGEDGVGDE